MAKAAKKSQLRQTPKQWKAGLRLSGFEWTVMVSWEMLEKGRGLWI